MIDIGSLSIEARCDYWRNRVELIDGKLLDLRQKYKDWLKESDGQTGECAAYELIIHDLEDIFFS